MSHRFAPISSAHNDEAQPLARGKYEAAKITLPLQCSNSDAKRLQKLIKRLALGDGKLSALLRQMRQLPGIKDGNQNLFTDMWMHCLPKTMQIIFASSQSDNIDDLTAIVDAVVKRLPA